MDTLSGKLVSVLSLVLLAPSSAIVITWDTLPGESLYPLKQSLESVASFIVSPSYQASSSLEISLVGRRIHETEVTLNSNSNQGLEPLLAQAHQARRIVLSANSTETQAVKITILSNKLQTAQKALETKRVELETSMLPQHGTLVDDTTFSASALAVNEPQPTSPEPLLIQEIYVAEEELAMIIRDINQQQGETHKTTASTPGPIFDDSSIGSVDEVEPRGESRLRYLEPEKPPASVEPPRTEDGKSDTGMPDTITPPPSTTASAELVL